MGTTSGEPGQGANLAPALTTRPCSNHPAFPVLSTLGGARREVDGDEGAQRREVITGQQIRAARELLGWTPYRLAPRLTRPRAASIAGAVLEQASVP